MCLGSLLSQRHRRKVHNRADKTLLAVNGANGARLIVHYCDGCWH